MVLLVDDDIDDLEMVHEAFVRNDFQGEIASLPNGEALMSRLKTDSKRPEIIILDLNMPLKDGFEVLAEIKTNERFSAIPVVILTASSNRHDEMRCKQLGCALFFRKPSSINDYDALVMLILNYLQSKQD